MHEGMPRQGPVSHACTINAFSMLTGLPARPDIHQPYLNGLARNTASAGVGDRITIVRASMGGLPFPDTSLDLLWAKGSIFIIGFSEGLASWRRLPRPGGYLCLTEAPSPGAAAL